MRQIATFAAALSLLACNGTGNEIPPPANGDAAGTRPAGQPQLATYEGRLGEGVECATLTTPEGDVWALSLPDDAPGTGSYVEIEAELADASSCMEGEGTLIPQSIREIEPPARDRDPARAGGLAVTSDYVQGEWVAKGIDTNCDHPDFRVTRNSNGLSLIDVSVDGKAIIGVVDVGETPQLHFDEPLPALPIETRGPDGLAVMPGPGGGVTLAGHAIEGDGVVFIKCA